MKKLVVAALAATVVLGSAVAPAFAEEGHGRTVKKVVIHRDHGRHHGWREGRHEGRHDGWRHRNVSKTVIIKGRHKTVIKKHEG